jgi:hypothetical protein
MMRRLAVGVVVLLAASAGAGIEHTILNGIVVAHVRASVGPGALPGVTKEALVVLAEARLKDGGVRRSLTADPDLLISVAVTTGQSGSCFVTVDARLVEEARLERNGLRVKAETWSGGSRVVVGAVPGATAGGPEQCATLTMRAADGLIRDFVEHYRAMNPGVQTGSK